MATLHELLGYNNARQDGVMGPIALYIVGMHIGQYEDDHMSQGEQMLVLLAAKKLPYKTHGFLAIRAQIAETNDQYVIGLHHDADMLCKFYINNHHDIPKHLYDNCAKDTQNQIDIILEGRAELYA